MYAVPRVGFTVGYRVCMQSIPFGVTKEQVGVKVHKWKTCGKEVLGVIFLLYLSRCYVVNFLLFLLLLISTRVMG